MASPAQLVQRFRFKFEGQVKGLCSWLKTMTQDQDFEYLTTSKEKEALAKALEDLSEVLPTMHDNAATLIEAAKVRRTL